MPTPSPIITRAVPAKNPCIKVPLHEELCIPLPSRLVTRAHYTNNNNPRPETLLSISNCLPHKSPTRTQEAKPQEMSDSAPTTPVAHAEGDANDAMDGVESGDGDLFGETPQEAEETEKEKEQKREEEDADGEFLREEPGSNTALTVIDVDSIVPVKKMTFVE